MSEALNVAVPGRKMSIDKVLATWPVLRQSVVSKFDDCALSAYFEMRSAQGWTTHPAARGTLFHRFAAECLRWMKAQDSEAIPVGLALATLEEVLEQRGIPPEERVRVPLREIPNLRMAATKFAKDNEFTIRNVIDVERRLSAPLKYTDDDGVIRERTLTGQLDVLVVDHRYDNGVVVIDWKDTWGLPPERAENAEDPGLSYHGFFQQRFYAWLVMRNYPQIDRVVLREFYPRRSKARPAAVGRDKLEQIEEDLANIVLELDRCLASGKPRKLKPHMVAPWNPSPGKHCHYCVAKHRCPIESDAHEGIIVRNAEEAERAVAELAVAEAVRKGHREALRPWVEDHGPVEARHSKARYVFGLKTNKNGDPELKFFVPEGSDRAPARQPEDKQLEDALRRSTETVEADKVDA